MLRLYQLRTYFVGMNFRSPPPLPSIFLMDGHLTKTRVGNKKGQIGAMTRSEVFFIGSAVPDQYQRTNSSMEL